MALPIRSQVVQELSSNLIVIEKLQSFQYKDPNMRDHGENVRHRAKQLCELVMDPERVREERKKVSLSKSGSVLRLQHWVLVMLRMPAAKTARLGAK